MGSSVEVQLLLAKVLIWPVLACLAFLFAWSLLELGGLVREFFDRRSKLAGWKVFMQKLHAAAPGGGILGGGLAV